MALKPSMLRANLSSVLSEAGCDKLVVTRIICVSAVNSRATIWAKLATKS